MKVDLLDNTLICEGDDLQTSLSYIKNNRKLSDRMEEGIIKVIFEELGIKYESKLKIEKQLELFPKEFIEKTVDDINIMFSNNKLIEYNNQYLSYLIYYLPVNTFKIWKPLLDLHIQSTLKRNMKILDIGTGPGSVPLGIIKFYKSLADSYVDIEFTLEFVLIDSEERFLEFAIKIIEIIKEDLPSNLSVIIKQIICNKITKAYMYDGLEKFDIITMSNFITKNEGNNSIYSYDIVRNFRRNLEEDGSMVIIEPGEEVNCIGLKLLRNELINNSIYNLYSPCIGIWDERNVYNCSCFGMARSYWEIPKIFSFLKEKGLSKKLRRDVPFNYIVLRIDGLRKYKPIRNSQHFTKLSNLNMNINNRVNIIAFIRTVIYIKGRVNIALCDGTTSFNGKNEEVWVYVSNEHLIDLGIDVNLIAGERVKLKKVEVKKTLNGISLELSEISTISIEY